MLLRVSTSQNAVSKRLKHDWRAHGFILGHTCSNRSYGRTCLCIGHAWRMKYIIFILVLFITTQNAEADTGSFPRPQVYTSGQTPGGQYNSVQEVCEAGIQNLNDAPDSWNPIYTLSGNTSSTCTYSAIYTTSGYPNHTFTGSFSYSFSYTSCPSGSTPNGTNCDWSCSGTDVWNSTTNSCGSSAPTCTSGQSAPNQWYELSQTSFSSTMCIAGCSYAVGTQVCGDTKCTVQAEQGTGETCTNSNTPPSENLTPEAQCFKKGQSYGTINGQVVCVPRATEGAAPTTSLTNGTKTIVENGQTTTINTNTNVSGDTVTTTTTTTNPDGSTSTKQETEDIPSYCTQNPYAEQCRQDKAVGDVTANPNGYTSTSFYTSKYPNGIEGVWQTAKDDIESSSAGQLIQNLTPNVSDSGTAPIWNMDFNLGALGNYGSYSLTPDSSLWLIIRTILIITSLFVARGLIFGG